MQSLLVLEPQLVLAESLLEVYPSLVLRVLSQLVLSQLVLSQLVLVLVVLSQLVLVLGVLSLFV